MLIDCDSCTVRGLACGDCVVTVLLGVPPAGVELDEAEQAAITALADQGLVPPLRLLTGRSEGPAATQVGQLGHVGQVRHGRSAAS
ncbi:MAG TPA: hypothetical protein VK662_09030 [Acidothermaceae bacterium]|jgi:hypothetical protein|nr:hypothetical protein [Acidothermaceae bacterium]